MPTEINKLNRDDALDKDNKPSLALLNLLNSLRDGAMRSQDLLDLIDGMSPGDVLGMGSSGLEIISPSSPGQRLTWTGTALLFAPPVKRQKIELYDRTAGTPIGNMTERGGLSAAFDGNPSKTFTTCAEAASANVGLSYIGKQFDSPQKLAAMVFYAATSTQINNGGGLVSVESWVSNSAPGNSTSGTLVSLPDVRASGSIQDIRTAYSTSLLDEWGYAWARINNVANGTQWCAQLEIYVYVDED